MRKKIYTFSIESKEIKHLLRADNRLSCLIKKIGNISYELYEDYFDFMINTIIGQMLSNQASTVISNRLYLLCNNSITPNSINNLTIADLRQIGISNAKSKYILNLSEFIIKNPKYFVKLNTYDDPMVINELQKFHGIGSWSAKMYLIFVLNRMDVLPYEDGAFLQSFKWLYSKKEVNKDYILKKCSPWKPYSSLVSRYLYKALDDGFTKQNIMKILK
ncbi:MAG: hypothetical protein LBI28_05005 [Treponema sp.]|jgi:DNA-3-methyladenine glycosylase II|nr:hypothetical protein [Treponema sp.]